MRKLMLIVVLMVGSLLSSQAQEKSFFVFLNLKPDVGASSRDSLIKIHKEWCKKGISDKKILFEGRFEGGGEVFLTSGTTAESVRAEWMNNNPGIKGGLFYVESVQAEPQNGTKLCAAALEEGSTSCKLIRLDGKAGLKDAQISAALKQNDAYLNKLNGEKKFLGYFRLTGSIKGVLLIVRPESKSEIEAWLKASPFYALSSSRNIRSFWFTKGMLCE